MFSAGIAQLLHCQRPPFSLLLDGAEQDEVLAGRPFSVDLRRIKVIHPFLTALLRSSEEFPLGFNEELPGNEVPVVFILLLSS
jgi:hypothetical protein